MNISEFASQHRFKVRRDECNDPIVYGRVGRSHFYDGFGDSVGLCFMPTKSGEDDPRTRLWNSTKEKCLAVGMTLIQDGEGEGCLIFDPMDRAQAKVAMTAIRARQKRVLTPEESATLAVRLAKGRQTAQSVQV